jgi:hypothetical protein
MIQRLSDAWNAIKLKRHQWKLLRKESKNFQSIDAAENANTNDVATGDFASTVRNDDTSSCSDDSVTVCHEFSDNFDGREQLNMSENEVTNDQSCNILDIATDICNDVLNSIKNITYPTNSSHSTPIDSKKLILK